jgi:hypothetical protein
MFKNLTIRNFRGISSIQMENLGAFNVLLGANNVGKTSVLETAFLLAGISNLKLPTRIQNFREFFIGNFDDLSYLFHDLAVTESVELSADSSAPDERRILRISASDWNVEDSSEPRLGSNGKNPSIAQKEKNFADSSSAIKTPLALRYDMKIQRSGETLSSSCLMLPNPDDTFHYKATEGFSELGKSIILARVIRPGLVFDAGLVERIIANKQESILLKHLRKMDPRIKDIQSGEVIRLDIGLSKRLPLNMFGSGLVRAVHILSSAIAGTTPADRIKILLIDEIEDGLHYKSIKPLLEALLSFCNSYGVQIFATTHSIDVLQILREILEEKELPEFRKKTVCYYLGRGKDGTVRSYRYGYESFDHCIKSAIEIR